MSLEIIKGFPPAENGMYVVFVEHTAPSRYADKQFLTYINNKWYYRGSDQQYRGRIFGYIGPLPAMQIRDKSKRSAKKFATGIMPDGLHGSFTGGPYDSIKQLKYEEFVPDKGTHIFSLTVGKEPKPIQKWENNEWVKIHGKV